MLNFAVSEMNYTDLHTELRAHFNLQQPEMHLPGSVTRIRNLPFQSSCNVVAPSYAPGRKQSLRLLEYNDPSILENKRFTYPVFLPDERPVYHEAIIMLHGLNERNWSKYLSWGYRLAEQTGKAVILFPIPFHINRAPGAWSDPRHMDELLRERKHLFPGIKAASHLNLALSRRLTELPERFILSGYQSARDLDDLGSKIRQGKHPLFAPGTRLDFFAYSIGVFLAQCMILGAPEKYLDRSRFFFFCGGALFSRMNGVSRFIMDELAHQRLHQYIVHDLESEIRRPDKLSDILNDTSLGKAFRSMIVPDRFRKTRENINRMFRKSIQAVVLEKDQVIPAAASAEVLAGGEHQHPSNVRILRLPYPCLHENPFPIRNEQHRGLVDETFEQVFTQAASFLSAS